ncbi:hypothetical protein E2C01_097682 [Portunus trituberculatus]|uniref:Secreted protein n=1 Tax=Portunus trituberculatus TaxID=210409 RepID=A0A5B7K110_PORTR|nr:hypothetical protein [Portunus trituberculatus]
MCCVVLVSCLVFPSRLQGAALVGLYCHEDKLRRALNGVRSIGHGRKLLSGHEQQHKQGVSTRRVVTLVERW